MRHQGIMKAGGARGTEWYAPASPAGREFALVIALALCGIASVLLVAFAPWYESLTAGGTDPSVARRPAPAASDAPAAWNGRSP
jgi:hypothetical protein